MSGYDGICRDGILPFAVGSGHDTAREPGNVARAISTPFPVRRHPARVGSALLAATK